VAWAGFVAAKLPDTYCEHDDVYGGAHASKHMEYFGCDPALWDHARPNIEITHPLEGTTIGYGSTKITYEVGGIGAPEAPTVFSVDGKEVGQADMPLGDTLTWTLDGLSPGQHSVSIKVAEPNNLRSFATATVHFTVDQATEAMGISNNDAASNMGAIGGEGDVDTPGDSDTSSDDGMAAWKDVTLDISEPKAGSTVRFDASGERTSVDMKFQIVGLPMGGERGVAIVFFDGQELGSFYTADFAFSFQIATSLLNGRIKRHSFNVVLLDGGVDTGVSDSVEFNLKPKK
jgi:hypothetical protein